MFQDFRDLMSEFSAEGVEFLVVGAHALAAYGHVRATKDLDLWVRPSIDNAQRIFRALQSFGAPLLDLHVDDLAREGLVFQIGVAPVRIDILTAVDGLTFEEAWQQRRQATFAGLAVPVLSRASLMQNKRASGRAQDLADVKWLEDHAE